MRRIKPYKSKRDMLLENKRMLDFMQLASDKPAQDFLSTIPAPPKKRAKTDATSEADVNSDIREYVKTRADVVLYRNNRGVIPLENGARITYGVGPNGATDWIGYKTVTITPAMVGKRVAVFTAVEAKRPGARARPDQVDFMLGIERAGGISGVASSKDELDNILGG